MKEGVDERAALALEHDGDGVARLVFDRPSSRVNLLTTEVMARLDALLVEIEERIRAGEIRAVLVRSGKEGTFIAGADIQEIVAITDPAVGEAAAREGQRIYRRLERLDVPTVAAVDGACLGGGTELILACGYRLASDRPETRIGLPEVRLGILPGFGGTTRLPRLIGPVAALDLILTGRTVDAQRARKLGLIDEAVPVAALYERAEALARERAAAADRPRPRRRPLGTRLLEDTPPGRVLLLRKARQRVVEETGGHYPAPLAILDVMRRSLGAPLERAFALEAEALGRLIVTPTSKNLIHVFTLMEAAKKSGPAGVEPRVVERAAVLGAGVMGGGIAHLLADHDVPVRLKDIKSDALALGLRHARSLFDRSVQRRRLARREAERRILDIAPSLEYTGFAAADIVIEAVVERLDVKRAVLREAESHVRPGCVLASNTSSLSITTMQEALERPADFCGMHFFNPVHRMPLVEVVRGRASSEEAVATVFAFARRLGKTPVIVNDGPGFLVNRVLSPYLNEAGRLLEEGATIERIDRTLVDFGMPMGPLRLLDEIGLDVARHAGAVMHEQLGERMAAPSSLAVIGEVGLLGRKSERGFYLYDAEGETGLNEEVARLIDAPADRAPDEVEIRDRCVLAMVNEAARVLDDGIAAEAGSVDLAMITGTGFPPFRGGLLRYADSLGTRAVLARLQELHAAHGSRFEPAPLLLRLAGAGRGFYD